MKKSFFVLTSVAAICGVCYFGVSKSADADSLSMLQQNEIEALTSCESIGWWDNDGNCVYNSEKEEYFCKDDSWHELTDCLR